MQHHFEWIGLPALSLAGAIENIYMPGPGAQVWMRNQDNRMKSFGREIIFPDIELSLHSGSWTQPDNNEASRSSRSRPSAPEKYLSKLPRGNISPFFRFISLTGTRTMLPSGLSCRENTCPCLVPLRSTRLRVSTFKVCMVGICNTCRPFQAVCLDHLSDALRMRSSIVLSEASKPCEASGTSTITNLP